MSKRRVKKVAKKKVKTKKNPRSYTYPRRKRNPIRKLSELDKEKLLSRLDRANSWVTYYSDLYSQSLGKKDPKKIQAAKKEYESSVRVRNEIIDELSSGSTYGQDF